MNAKFMRSYCSASLMIFLTILMIPLEAGKEVAATIPGAELCVINGLGHDISMEFVDKIVDCIVKIAEKSAGQIPENFEASIFLI